jgi:hypothetical protein
MKDEGRELTASSVCTACFSFFVYNKHRARFTAIWLLEGSSSKAPVMCLRASA